MKATLRPTTAQLQAIKAKADRRQAALDRRAERAAGIETEVQQMRRLYTNAGC